MKKLIIIIPLIFCACCLYAQNTEEEIRKLEQIEVQAILAKDTVVLKKLWDKDYIVHNPANKIVLANANPVNRPVLQNERTSFTRTVEKITIRGDIVFSMGSETVAPAGGQTVKRRYTNIWMKVDDTWKLVARHANEICQEK